MICIGIGIEWCSTIEIYLWQLLHTEGVASQCPPRACSCCSLYQSQHGLPHGKNEWHLAHAHGITTAPITYHLVAGPRPRS